MSEPAPEDRGSRAVERSIGAALMAIGALIAALCGACTMIFTVGSIASALKESASATGGFLLFVAIVGGLPTLIGVFVFREGLRRYRGPPASDGRNRP